MRIGALPLLFLLIVSANFIPKEESLKNALFSYRNETRMVPENETINVFIVAHTHLDPGYLVTADQYFVKNARFILDSLMAVLKLNKDRKFTFVEQSFFQRWWNEQNESTRAYAKKVIQEGRLELNLGGWVMPDEATTQYEDVINQMTLGHKYIYDQFGVRPRVAWHVDPFGHSNQMAALYADMGYDAFSFWRILYSDMQERKKNRTLEFVWRGSQSSGRQSDIFAYCLDSGYYTPNEGNFFASTQGEVYYVTEDERWLQWNEDLPTYKVNIEMHAEAFNKMVRTRSVWYDNGNNLLIPWGGDFSFFLAFMPFDSMDKFIEYMNAHEDKYHIHMQYSTLSEYVQKVHQYKKKWTLKRDDFFPLADGPYGYWTGFYTTRDRLKGLIRSWSSQKMNELANAEMVLGMAKAKNLPLAYDSLFAKVLKLRKAQGETQHHDAITGTNRQAVAEDYYVQLANGAFAANEATAEMLAAFTTVDNINRNATDVFSRLTEKNAIMVLFSNVVGWTRKEMIQLILPRRDIGVYDKKGKEIESQINEIPEFSYDRRNGTHYLYFVQEIPPMGYSSVYLKIKPTATVQQEEVAASITNGLYTLSLDNGYVTHLGVQNHTYSVSINLYQYLSVDGDPMISNAYCFNPIEKDQYVIGSSSKQEKEGSIRILNNGEKRTDPSYLYTVRSTSNYKDTFVPVLTQQRNDTIHYYVRRMDGDSWSQEVELSVLPFDASLNEKNLQSGRVALPPSDQSELIVTVHFQTPFDTFSPIVVFTSILSPSSELFVTSVLSVTAEGAEILVRHVLGHSWSEGHQLQYIAFTNDTFPFAELDHQYEIHSVECPLPSEGSFVSCPVQLTTSYIKPRVLLQCQSSAVPLMTVTDVTKNSFRVNMILENSLGVDHITVLYLAYSSRLQGDYVVPPSTTLQTKVVRGPLVEEIQQSYRQGYDVVYRLYKSGMQRETIEISTEMNGIDDGSEVTLMVHSDIDNQQTIFTDAMGMEQQERRFNFDNVQPIPSNYYPCTSRAYIQNKEQNLRMTMLFDRAHGVGSTTNGNINVMVKRRTVDHYGGGGIGEPIWENDHVQAKYRLLLNEIEYSTKLYKQHDLLFNHPPLPFFAIVEEMEKIQDVYSGLVKSLPPQLQLLNFQLVGLHDQTFLLRLHHLYEKHEDESVTIDLRTLFKDFTIVDYEEMVLTGMFKREEVEKERLHWETEDDEEEEMLKKEESTSSIRGGKSFIVTLNPMEFKTFQVTVK